MKILIFNNRGNNMNKLLFTLLIAASFSASAGTAFYKGEKISGMNKICYYDHIGSEVAITIKSYDICPVTIQV